MKRLAVVVTMAISFGAGWANAEQFRNASAEGRAVPVRHVDLDLSRTEDAALMLDRLRFATARACAIVEVDRPNPAARRAVEACRADALAEAVRRLDAPELTRLHVALRN